MNKTVLDACCGTRMFWFDKNDDRTVYLDKRKGFYIVDRNTPGTRGRKPKVVEPDILGDFTKLPFPDETFYHVVFDPPHLEKNSKTGVLMFSYGYLDETWPDDLTKGFAECFRVLKPFGTLIFKWCETEISLKKVLSLTPEKPLYGHRSGKKAMTHWVTFIKDGNK